MADVVLSGREITFDLEKMTIKEFRELFDPNQSDEKGDEIIARVSGMTADDISALSFVDYKKLSKAFFKKAKEPLADPN